MQQSRHCNKISATVVAGLCAATSSISICGQSALAEETKSIAMSGAAHTQSTKKAPATKSMKMPSPKAMYPRNHFEKACYFKQQRDLNNALIEFIKSTQENPQLVRAFYEQALIFRERGYLKLASSALEQALAVKPDYQDARILLATISIQQGNVGGAVRELTRSLGLDNAVENKDKNNVIANPTLQKVTLEVSKKVKDADDAIDAMPVLVLQSIHPAIKETPAKPTAKSEEIKNEEASKSASTIESVEQSNKHFDLNTLKDSITNSIKNSLKDSVESAMHAPLNLSTYWSHLPFGNSQPVEKVQEQEQEKKDSDNARESKADSHKKEKKEKKQKHKRKKNGEAKEDRAEIAPSASVERNDTSDSTAALPDFVKQAIRDHNEAEEEAEQVEKKEQKEQIEQIEQIEKAEKTEQNTSSNKTLFAATNFSQSTRSIIKNLQNSGPTEADAPKPTTVHLDSDEWAVKLRNLVEHGTNSLKDGEAFMFAEDTGEASLFLADGSVIRRIVQAPRDQNEIVRQRRPDMLVPDDLLYKLSLLGKLIPHAENANTPNNASPSAELPNKTQSPQNPSKDFEINSVMGDSEHFWGWLRNAFKF